LSIGQAGVELELHPSSGHTADGTSFWLPWVSVLVCGDYLSPVEIPTIGEGGSVSAYVETLERLSGFVERAATIVPGHGAPVGSEQARRVLEEDLAYLRALLDGAAATLPEGRRDAHQRALHAANLASLG
jgi:glyoxylase-like metal-dependent hydrolase (beta-lactamase superfamily II)